MASRDVESGFGQVAVIDDDEGLVEVICENLEGKGYRARALSAETAAAALTQERPDVVLVGDLAASGGVKQLAGAIRSMPDGESVPLVLLTGGGALEPGALNFFDFRLFKPFQLGQLHRVIKAFRSEDGSYHRPEGQLGLDARSVHDLPDFPERGSLETTPFVTIFSAIWRAASTGTLLLKSGSTRRRLEFVNGFLVLAQSNLVTEHLLRYLLRNDYISPDTYRLLLPETQRPDWQPETLTAEAGPLSRLQLAEAQRKLVQEVAQSCFRWSSASFQFHADLVHREKHLRSGVNPLHVLLDWLADSASADWLEPRARQLANRQLVATPAFDDNSFLVVAQLAPLGNIAHPFDGSRTLSQLVQEVPQPELAQRLIVSLVALGMVEATAAQEPSGRKPSPRRARPGRRFARIRQMVQEDLRRVERAKNPYVVLRLPEGAGAAEVAARYQRLCRFYRIENFERIGDRDLLETAKDLLDAFRRAATAILGAAPPDPESPAANRIPTPTVSDDDRVLAEVFFDDGTTYLKIDALDEAYRHFRRSAMLEKTNPKYLTYFGWAAFKRAQGNREEIAEAKQTLLNAIKLDGRNDRALFFLGCLYEQVHRLDRAMECWKKALNINPGNYDAQDALRRHGDQFGE